LKEGLFTNLTLGCEYLYSIIYNFLIVWSTRTYGEPLHRLREWGLGQKEMDLAQQQRLSPDQMKIICSMLLFNSVSDLPNPMDNWDTFLAKIKDANRREQEVWSPYSRGARHWVFIQDLNLAYSPRYVTAHCVYYGLCAFCLPCFW
jgi:hypothetical protein